MKLSRATRANVYKFIVGILKDAKPEQMWNVSLTKWKPRRTLDQNSFFHLLCGHLEHELNMDSALIKEGIKQRYGYKEQYRDSLIPKPSSMCNKFEEISALIEGCFVEAGEQGIDMRDFINEWQEIKRQQGEAK